MLNNLYHNKKSKTQDMRDFDEIMGNHKIQFEVYTPGKQTKNFWCEILVLPHFNSSGTVYNLVLSCSDRRRLQRVQNSCFCLIYGLRGSDTCQQDSLNLSD